MVDMSAWSYKGRIKIVANTDLPAGYQTKIEIAPDWDLWDYVKPDGGDLRFAKEDESELLPYYIEDWKYESRKAVVWVRLPEAVSAGSEYYINVYAGNQDAESESDAKSVFDFYDDFETWDGWVKYGSGVISQSDLYVMSGSYSLRKTVNGDPNGGYKEIGTTLGRNVVLEAWVLRDANPGANADRFGLIDSNGNGYGFIKDNSADYVAVDKRSGYKAVVNSKVTAKLTNMKWYKCRLIISGDSVISEVIDDTGELKRSVFSDTAYSEFSRVYVFGGYPYNVDKIVVRQYVDSEPDVVFEKIVSPVDGWDADKEWVSGWKYRRELTISNNTDSDVIGEFIPVKLKKLPEYNEIKDDLGKVLFTTKDGVKLEAFVSSVSGYALIYIDELKSGESLDVYMFYGNDDLQSDIYDDITFMYEDFSEYPELNFGGVAYYDVANKRVVLTRNQNSVHGEYYTDLGTLPDYMKVVWESYVGGGSGADAIYTFYGGDSLPDSEDASINGFIVANDDYSDDLQIRYNGTMYKIDTTELSGRTLTNVTVYEKGVINWVVSHSNEAGVMITTFKDSPQGTLIGFGGRCGGSNNWHVINWYYYVDRDMDVNVDMDVTFGDAIGLIDGENWYLVTIYAKDNWGRPLDDVTVKWETYQKTVKYGGVVWIKGGSYNVVFEKDGYSTTTLDLAVSSSLSVTPQLERLPYQEWNADNSFLSGWKYRRTIVVKNNDDVDYRNAVIDVDLKKYFDDFGKFNVDLSDVRVSDLEGRPIEYWVDYESKVLYVAVPYIGAGVTVSLYMFYGNAGVTSQYFYNSGEEFFRENSVYANGWDGNFENLISNVDDPIQQISWDGGSDIVAGGYNKFGSGAYLRMLANIGVGKYKIRFRAYFIDSWDTETLYFRVLNENGDYVDVWSGTFKYDLSVKPDGFVSVGHIEPSNTTWDNNGYVDVEVDYAGAIYELYFTSNLNEKADNESWAISRVVILQSGDFGYQLGDEVFNPVLTPPEHPQVGWLNGWNYRKIVSLYNRSDEDKNGGFFLVYLDEGNFDGWSEAQVDGSDIRFTDMDGLRILDYDKVYYDSTKKIGVFIVKYDRLIPAKTSVGLYMYYGNPSVTNASQKWSYLGKIFYEYYNDNSWTNKVSQGYIDRINFDWGQNAVVLANPSSETVTDNVTLWFKWFMIFPESKRYVFVYQVDDDIWYWIQGVAEDWPHKGIGSGTFVHDVSKGVRFFQLKYLEKTGSAVVKFGTSKDESGMYNLDYPYFATSVDIDFDLVGSVLSDENGLIVSFNLQDSSGAPVVNATVNIGFKVEGFNDDLFVYRGYTDDNGNFSFKFSVGSYKDLMIVVDIPSFSQYNSLRFESAWFRCLPKADVIDVGYLYNMYIDKSAMSMSVADFYFQEWFTVVGGMYANWYYGQWNMWPEGFVIPKVLNIIVYDDSAIGVPVGDVPLQLFLDDTNFSDWDKLNDDGSDIRFYDLDSGVELKYWIENFDKTNHKATIWIKPASVYSSGKKIRMYYGNANATPVSDGSSVFLFFDDFDGTDIDTTKWTKDSDNVNYTIENSELIIQNETGIYADISSLVAGKTVAIESKVRVVDVSQADYSSVFLAMSSSPDIKDGNSNSDALFMIMINSGENNDDVLQWVASGSSASFDIVSGSKRCDCGAGFVGYVTVFLDMATKPRNLSLMILGKSDTNYVNRTFAKDLTYLRLGYFTYNPDNESKQPKLVAYDWVKVRELEWARYSWSIGDIVANDGSVADYSDWGYYVDLTLGVK